MTEERKKFVLLGFFLVMALLLIYVTNTESSYQKEIRENPGKTICKYVARNHYAKTTNPVVKYYAAGKLYISEGYGGYDEGSIDDFYELKYSTIDPNKIEIDFSKKVKDTTLTHELDRKLQFKYWFYHEH
ncbi:hypothetical protein [Flavobacterium sp. 3HN19-14]|uniref:hypothetical protein n=1 Tax=Flavobacterium sp. 3HN19-14 TaxID=3448133 RepID=UPI003EDF8340